MFLWSSVWKSGWFVCCRSIAPFCLFMVSSHPFFGLFSYFCSCNAVFQDQYKGPETVTRLPLLLTLNTWFFGEESEQTALNLQRTVAGLKWATQHGCYSFCHANREHECKKERNRHRMGMRMGTKWLQNRYRTDTEWERNGDGTDTEW